MNIRIIAYSFISLLIVNCFSFNSVKIPLTQERESDLVEHVIEGTDRDKILVISIDGVISEHAGGGSFLGASKESAVSTLISELAKASTDSSIKGIILRVDSPGGTVTGSDIIYREIVNFKKKHDIPVVALFMDRAMSGGYYVAMSSDRIVAHPTSTTGSIGVILSGLNVKEGLSKIGVKDQSITSGANKAIGSPFHEMTPEQKIILQSVVDGLYERFFSLVKKGRPKASEERLKVICDGRIFTADQALKEHLVDSIGYIDEAVSELMKLPNYKPSIGTTRPKLVAYTYSKQKPRSIYQLSTEESSRLSAIENLLKINSEMKFMYLWTY